MNSPFDNESVSFVNRPNTYFLCILLFVFSTSYSLCQDITIGLFTDMGAIVGDNNIMSSMSGGVTTFTPTGTDAQLTDVTLNAALVSGNVIIKTTSGDVFFAPGTFEPSTPNRTLTLESSGNASLAIMGSTNQINIVALVADNFFTIGESIHTVGGSVMVNANKITVDYGGLITGTGIVQFMSTDSTFIKGVGVETNGANVEIDASTLNIIGSGIRTNGGDVIVNTPLGDIEVQGEGINTVTGNIEINSVNYYPLYDPNNYSHGGNGLRATTGTIILNLTGDAYLGKGGIFTTTGKIAITAIKAQVRENGIGSTSGDIEIITSDSTLISGNSVESTNGNITIKAKFIVFDDVVGTDGIQAYNEKVVLETPSELRVTGNGIFSNELQILVENNLMVVNGGIHTTGDTKIEATGSVTIDGGGINSSGTGEVNITGATIDILQTIMSVSDKSTILCSAGDLNVTGGGISTSGAAVVNISSNGDVVIQEGGIMTDNSMVDVNTGGGSISLSGCGIGTGAGAGGMLNQSGTDSTFEYTTVARPGGRDINLKTDEAFRCLPSVLTFNSYNEITFSDPCSCSDTLNCTIANTYYFHDVLRIPNTGSIASGLDIRINTSANFYLTGSCGGTSPIPPITGTSGTRIIETSTGVYELDFWRESGILPSLSVIEFGMITTVPPSVFEPICTEVQCAPEPIPTLSQWAIIILMLSFIIIGIVGVKDNLINKIDY